MHPHPANRLRIWMVATVAIALACLSPSRAAEDAIDAAISAIRAVGPEGQGNTAAAAAWRSVASLPATAIPRVLGSMRGTSDLAANWLRTAIDVIVERELKSSAKLPVLELGTLLLETSNDPRARRIAFELLGRVEPDAISRLIPGLLDDPAPALRREAVARILAEATSRLEAGARDGAALLYRQALNHARDVDQIEALTKSLRGLGQTVDLIGLFGFITRWQVIGPFDNAGGRGFNEVFPPERALNLDTELDGKTGKVRWTEFVARDDYGIVDLNVPCGKLKEVAGYATTTFVAESAQAVELRLATENSWKLWLNGQLLFARDEYHRGREIDQYRIPVTLQPGPNVILVKVCQNEMVEDWTVEWQFQLRITDAAGAPLRAAIQKGDQP